MAGLWNAEAPKRGRWKRTLLISAGVALGIYAIFFVMLVLGQGKMIFPAPPVLLRGTPAAAGFEDLRIPVNDKTFFRAWWVPAADPHAKVVVYFHGNAELLEEEDEELSLFREAGLSALLVEYRGDGRSSQIGTSGKTTREDALAAMRYLHQARHVATSDVILCGRSIGSGVAVQLALDEPQASGLILITPFTSVAEVANDTGTVPYILRPAEWFLGENKFDNAAKMGRVRMPVLVIAGSADTLASPRMTRELTARTTSEKKLVMVDGAGHNDVLQVGRNEVSREVAAFVKERSQAK